MNETDIIKVYIPNGTVKSVRYDFETKVQRVMHVVLTALGIDRVSFGYFALRLIPSPVTRTYGSNTDCYWLHSSFTMRHVYNKFFNNTSTPTQLRFELRLRFIPKDLQEMYQTEMDAFMFLHDQILADYKTQVSWKVPVETAIELAALQIRRKLGNPNLCAIEKCLNLDEMEAEGTLSHLLPEAMLVNMKPKLLKKALTAGVKRHASLTPTECVFQFMEIIRRITQFDIEIFKASLGVGWKNPLDVMVGMVVGIAYTADGRCGPTLLTKLQYVISLTISKLDETSEKAVINLKLTGSAQQLPITLPTWTIAESLAHLINGYNMLLSQRGPIWTPPELSDDLKRHETKVRFADGGELSFNSPKNANLRMDRSRVSLEELLGDGQFGNVYKGTFTKEDGLTEAVAVKVCKIDSEAAERQNFLEEAFIMHRFHHEHIIALVGVCMETPIWIVMELAALGELRQYLLHNSTTMDLSIQLLFSQQLSSAIFYLHSCKYVHRDIAARNVLVSSSRCVKLSDFGLSRCVEEGNIYTSTRGKLPIKWMAPESINYRRFSTATDVWMFGVCIWEILTFGIKPWNGIRNHNVILEIESGSRLERPDSCPQVLYDLLLRMWDFEPSGRPTILEVNRYLGFLLDQIDCHVPYGLLTAPSDEEIGALIREESQKNGFLKVAPMLKVDSSTVPTSTLWRTLEQQRIQSEEDDRWLEEEEEKLLPLPALSTVRTQNITSFAYKQPLLSEQHEQPNGLPVGFKLDRRNDSMHEGVFKVVGAITNLSKEFHSTMSNEQFSELVKIVTDELENLFNESKQQLTVLKSADQQEVKLVEALLESDMRNLTETIKMTLEKDISEESCETLRREVLKITHRLAFNCKQFLETVDSARIRSGVAKLQLKDSAPFVAAAAAAAAQPLTHQV